MKAVKTTGEILLNISGVFEIVCLFANWGTVFWILFFLQPFIPVYNYYRAKSFEKLKLFSLLFILSNIAVPVSFKIYYEFIFKNAIYNNTLSWNSVASEIALVATLYIFIIAAALLVIGCILSVVTYRVKHKEDC